MKIILGVLVIYAISLTFCFKRIEKEEGPLTRFDVLTLCIFEWLLFPILCFDWLKEKFDSSWWDEPFWRDKGKK